ncbi:MAG: hypothetical protein CMJ83_06645 [Planctomycetes bacterium]|nr:hypothetical protein [Planctomycetota bacterium]
MTTPTPRPDPAALLSFPKCGRTWLKLMMKLSFEDGLGLSELQLDGHRDWHRTDARLPKLTVEHDDNPHFKAVDELPRDRDRFSDARILLLVRDPRDVMVSLFFEMTKRTKFYEEWGFDTSRVVEHTEDFSQFIRGPVGRLDTLLAYWSLWGRARDAVKGFHLVRYEDMHTDAEGTLAGVLDFVGVPATPDVIARAVERCRFDRMKADEAKNTFESKTLTAADPQDPESFKVRRGKVGGFVDYLSPGDIAFIDDRCATLPPFLDCYRKQGEKS